MTATETRWRQGKPPPSPLRRLRRLVRLVTRAVSLDADRLFYYPDRVDRGTPADLGLAFEDVSFSAPNGPLLHGWFLPAPDRPSRGTVLHLHGNAGNVGGHVAFVAWLPAAGYDLLVFDYRGFGRSQGRTTREGTVQDAHAALDYLRTRRDVRSDRIAVFGQSIGGTVAVVLASRRRNDLCAAVVDSAFHSYRNIVRYHVRKSWVRTFLAWWLPRFVSDGFDPIDHVAEISPVPILFLHGRSDRVTPWQSSQRLYDAAGRPKDLWLIDGLDHCEVWEQQPDQARRRVLDFLDRAMDAGTDGSGRLST